MQRTEERQGDPKFDERESVMRFEIARRGDAVGARARIASRQALPSALRRHPGGTAQTKSSPSAMRSIMGNGPLVFVP
jgi:hypothetical protein